MRSAPGQGSVVRDERASWGRYRAFNEVHRLLLYGLPRAGEKLLVVVDMSFNAEAERAHPEGHCMLVS